MGKLIKGSKWASDEFEKGSRPTKQTMIRWIDAEEIPGRVIDGEPYVDADRFAIADTAQKKRITGLDLIA